MTQFFTIAGIDPGLNGGYSTILGGRYTFSAQAIPMPEDLLVHLQLLDPTCSHVFIEKAQPMVRPGRGQGAAGMFSYAMEFGRILGMLEALKLPHTLVRSQQWQKAMHSGTSADDTKKRSIEACRRLFPSVDLKPGKRKKDHDGMAEALLIAEFGRRMLSPALPLGETKFVIQASNLKTVAQEAASFVLKRPRRVEEI